jgi:hypothetical protein
MEIVYEFLYNPSCCESVYGTVSIHKTRQGAETAMEFHKYEKKKQYDDLMECDDDDEYKEEFPYDYDQWWGVRETELQN